LSLAGAIATLGGLGRAPRAPGTIASFVTLVAAWFLAGIGGQGLVLFASIAAMAIGGWAAEHYARERATADPPDCVIDEMAGQFLACAFAPRALLAYALAFLLFRALDIFKPWPIGAAEKFHGGIGIVADDAVAGLLAGFAIVLLVQVFPPSFWGWSG
jgi:phosphatidylglycerophosphatase A